LKTGVSALALISTLLWIICVYNAYGEIADHSARVKIIAWMPALFLVCWIVSLGFHGRRFYRQFEPASSTDTKDKTSSPKLPE
jgi:uncharacterized membrane protein YGL010W